jgi:YD repeat-containing protein
MWTTYVYDKLDRATTMLSIGGPQELTTYDSAGQTTSIIHNAYGPTLLNWFTYMYDPNGNVVTAQDFQMGSATTYSYDANDRLTRYSTSVGSAVTVGTYAYDANDSLTLNPEGSQNLFVMDAASRITSVQSFAGNVVTYVWDANGNTLALQDAVNGYYTMTYDFENRLKTHKRPDALVATYLYDGDGLKRVEFEYGGLTTIIWDGADYVQMQFSNSAYEYSATVPTSMTHGHQYMVTLTFANWPALSAPWMADRGFQLFQIAPGLPFAPQSVFLNPNEVVPPLTNRTFAFLATAPATPGTYTLQYQMFSPETIQFGSPGNPHTITVV